MNNTLNDEEKRVVFNWKRAVDECDLNALKKIWHTQIQQGSFQNHSLKATWTDEEPADFMYTYTLYHGNVDLLQWLLSEEGPPRHDNVLLDAFIQAFHDKNHPRIKVFTASMNPLLTDEEGDSAFMYATAYGMLDVMQAMVEKGADPDHENKNGESALFDAIRAKQQSTFEWILPLIDPSKLKKPNNEGVTPFMVAAEYNHCPALEQLLPVSDVNAVNAAGNTAFMEAIDWKSMEAMRLLLPFVDWNVINRAGQSVFSVMDRSLKDSHPEIWLELMVYHKMTEEKKALSSQLKHIEAPFSCKPRL